MNLREESRDSHKWWRNMYLVYDICVNVSFIRYLLLLFNITSPTESVIGKITLVKYLFLSTFTCNLLALTNPSEATLNGIDDECAKIYTAEQTSEM